MENFATSMNSKMLTLVANPVHAGSESDQSSGFMFFTVLSERMTVKDSCDLAGSIEEKFSSVPSWTSRSSALRSVIVARRGFLFVILAFLRAVTRFTFSSRVFIRVWR